MDVEGKTIPRLLREKALKYQDVPAQYFRDASGDFDFLTYGQMWNLAMDFAGALLSHNVGRGEKIGLIADDRKEWQQASLGILAVGAVDVPRGTDASREDLKYILSFVECKICVAETSSAAKKILDSKNDLPMLKSLIKIGRAHV